MSNEKVIKVGYQGVPGSFSEQALTEYFPSDIQEINYPDFEDVLVSLEKDYIDFGVLPIENSSTGGISETYQLIRNHNCSIVGERCIKVEHHLLGIKGSELDEINQVYSHPQAYQQSSHFFKKHSHILFCPYKNTAESAKYIGELNQKNIGAIASRKAAGIYDLEILAENINFNYKNYTRFAILGKTNKVTDLCNKISIVITVPHTPGSLYRAMRHFEENNINLTKIESRPLIDKPWQYFFYLDLEGNLNDPVLQTALDKVNKASSYFKIFGNYASHDIIINEEGLDSNE